MGQVYMKIMVSFDADEKELANNTVEVVERALKKGVKIDGEVYFPMTDYNDKLYEMHNKPTEINVDYNFDGQILKMTK